MPYSFNFFLIFSISSRSFFSSSSFVIGYLKLLSKPIPSEAPMRILSLVLLFLSTSSFGSLLLPFRFATNVPPAPKNTITPPVTIPIIKPLEEAFLSSYSSFSSCFCLAIVSASSCSSFASRSLSTYSNLSFSSCSSLAFSSSSSFLFYSSARFISLWRLSSASFNFFSSANRAYSSFCSSRILV